MLTLVFSMFGLAFGMNRGGDVMYVVKNVILIYLLYGTTALV